MLRIFPAFMLAVCCHAGLIVNAISSAETGIPGAEGRPGYCLSVQPASAYTHCESIGFSPMAYGSAITTGVAYDLEGNAQTLASGNGAEDSIGSIYAVASVSMSIESHYVFTGASGTHSVERFGSTSGYGLDSNASCQLYVNDASTFACDEPVPIEFNVPVKIRIELSSHARVLYHRGESYQTADYHLNRLILTETGEHIDAQPVPEGILFPLTGVGLVAIVIIRHRNIGECHA